MEQICSRYAAICSKYSNWQQFDKYGRREEEDELLDFKKHSIFIDVLKNTYYCRVWVVISEQCESLTELLPGICVNIQYILVKFNGRIIFRKNKMVGRH